MTLLRDIIQKKGGDVYSVNPDATVLEALKLMADKNIGAVLISRNTSDFRSLDHFRSVAE